MHGGSPTYTTEKKIMYSLNSEDKNNKFSDKTFAIRLHRAKSWVNCSIDYSQDDDISFISGNDQFIQQDFCKDMFKRRVFG